MNLDGGQTESMVGPGERVCARCGDTKPIEEFHVRYRETGERLTCCRACMAEYKRAWYMRNTQHQKDRVRANSERTTGQNQILAWQYLANHPCVDCGETDPVVLQFDHLDTKFRDISTMLRTGFPWPAIALEIEKCDVRCGNCHRRKTARAQGIYDEKHAFMKPIAVAPPSDARDN